MGTSYSTARWLAPLSFAVNFAAQNYGLLSTPNMKDVHDAHLSFFSPQPYFIGAFFFPQQLVQLAWLWRLRKAGHADRKRGGSDSGMDEGGKDRDLALMVDYTPFFALGNFCIATWMIFWNRSELQAANHFVMINSIAQLFYLTTRLPALNTSSTNSILTHIVAKTFAGIGVLDLLHNGSVAYFDNQVGPAYPPSAVRVLTGLVFVAAGAVSDSIFGACLAYDLVALGVGQRNYGAEAWGNMLLAYAAGTAAVVGLRNWVWWPRTSGLSEGYETL